MESVFKLLHSLFPNLLNDWSACIIQINVFCGDLSQDCTKVLWILKSNHSCGFLKMTLLWVLFWKCTSHLIPLYHLYMSTTFRHRHIFFDCFYFIFLTLSENQKLTSINYKVWKCSNFFTFQLIESKTGVDHIWHGGIIFLRLYVGNVRQISTISWKV